MDHSATPLGTFPDEDDAAAAPSGARTPRITLASPVLAARQRTHALAILVLPALALPAALWWHQNHPLWGSDIALAAALYVLTLLGISAGFHRHFAHRAFAARPAVRVVLGVLGSMAAQGPPIYWVSNHRRHHRYSDGAQDPHSPQSPRPGGARGFWHAQVGWTLSHEITNSAYFARDLLADPLMVRVNALYFAWVLLGIALPPLAGWALHGWEGAVSGLLWGAGIRLFLTLHFTNAINSLCHMVGRQPHATGDASRNNAWLALPTLGESWHNNHHACPWSASFSSRWSEPDATAGVIRLLERLGLVSQVRRAGAADWAAAARPRRAQRIANASATDSQGTQA